MKTKLYYLFLAIMVAAGIGGKEKKYDAKTITKCNE